MTEHEMQLLDEQEGVELSGGDVCDREPVQPRPIPSLNSLRHALAKALPESIEAHERPLEVGRRAHR